MDVPRRAVRLARLSDGDQSQDRYHEHNCGGFGRIRRFEHFKLFLGHGASDRRGCLFRKAATTVPFFAQSFQLAACDVRCWYCFVDDARLSANAGTSELVSASTICQLFLADQEQANILDLSGGQPDLVPEWTLWMLEELRMADRQGDVFVWVDDNLCNDFFWRFLTDEQIDFVCKFPGLSRAGCFKGFDASSFAFNTGAQPEGFTRQFELFKRFLDAGSEMYGYVTFTSRPTPDLAGGMAGFVDRLQEVHPMLPLRVLPLKIHPFTATRSRAGDSHVASIEYQYQVYDAWRRELDGRFSVTEMATDYDRIDLL